MLNIVGVDRSNNASSEVWRGNQSHLFHLSVICSLDGHFKLSCSSFASSTSYPINDGAIRAARGGDDC